MTIIWDADVPCSVFKTHAEDHLQTKEQLLPILLSAGTPYTDNSSDSFIGTDWFAKNKGHQYADLVKPHLQKHASEVVKKLKASKYKITCVWFQRYGHHDRHGWHFHDRCMFSGIYYVELPPDAPRTNFDHLGKTFYLPSEEGDIISFPSFLKHCSEPNTSKQTKTIVGFNFDVVA